MIDKQRERIEGLKDEVEFYRDGLRDRRHTTAALTDVIEAFRLTLRTTPARQRANGATISIAPSTKGMTARHIR